MNPMIKQSYCIACDNEFKIEHEEEWYPVFCPFCGADLKLSYDFLKEYCAVVVLKKDINMGHHQDYELEHNETSSFYINDQEEIIIPKGTTVGLQVQSHNFHYELLLVEQICFDYAAEEDIDLNETFSLIEIDSRNRYFTKEED